MTTPATITTEELDELAAHGPNGCTHAEFSRLIEQARKWIEAESQDYNPDQHAYGLMWQERNKEAMRAICAESALSATRERLEQVRAIIAEGMPCDCITSVVDGKTNFKLCGACKISAIAAKAGTGGKGEAEKQNETEK